MKGLRTSALFYLSRAQGGVTKYALAKATQVGRGRVRSGKTTGAGTASEILEGFYNCGIVSREKPGFRGLMPYSLNSQGQRLVRLMKYLGDQDLISESKNLDLQDDGGSKDFVQQLEQGGFSLEDFEKALACGLIHKRIRVVRITEHSRGFFIPTTPKNFLLGKTKVRITYIIN
ncbi:MAG: hypothetical protein ABSG74_02655 [Candidatus Bathyarchaeia archaeon]